VRADVQRRYIAELDPALAGTVWNAGGCNSWYLDATGRNSVMWPTFTWRYRSRTKEFDAHSFASRPRGGR